MTHLQKLGTTSILKLVSITLVENFISVSKTPFWPSGSVYIAQNSRLYGTKRGVENANIEHKVRISPASSDSKYFGKLYSAALKAAQAALLEYLHLTSNLKFLDAENMSKNSPYFVENLLKSVEKELDLKEIISQFLRYHPINEYEPFFESMGLKPNEYRPFLPHNLMFLSDDDLLLENYYVLCNYGVERKKIGNIYKEARDIFQYDFGVLSSKLQAYEKLGLSQSIIGKVIVYSPYILIGDVNMEFVKVLKTLKSLGVKFSLIKKHVKEQNSYNWSKMLRLLNLFSEMGLSEEQLGKLIRRHPRLLLEGSGDGALTLIGLLLKFGYTLDEVRLMFLQSRKILVGRFFSPFWPSGSVYIAQNSRLFGTKRGVQNANIENKVRISPASSDSNYVSKLSSAAWKAAQAALLEYLHLTRNLQFLDAENMSKNSPYFVEKLLKWLDEELDLKEIISRFLRYHPINEFEPFFESIGLKPSEYSPFLPRNLMFLSDDDLLLENYYVLCNYGVERKNIGKIYKEARGIFRYDFGVLSLKLQAYGKLGLSQSNIVKVIVCSPYILIGDLNMEFVKVLETLKSIGVKFSLMEEHLMEQNSYNWSKMLRLLSLFSEMGLSEEQLGTLIQQNPGLLLEGSGDGALTLIGLLLKFGSTLDEVRLMFLQVPQIPVECFFANLKECFKFFFEIDMEMDEIGKIFRSHSMLLGTCTLMKTSSIFHFLNVGKTRLCEYIQGNPNNLKNLVRGSKVERLPNARGRERRLMLRAKLLEDVGFGLIQNPSEMERTVEAMRGRGEELQQRFDCIVNAGLDRKDVCEMIRVSPRILSRKKEVLEAKIDFLLHDLGYPISCLLSFPSYLHYAVERIKLRLMMYNWLTEQGKVESMFSLKILVELSNKRFMQRFVNQHPEGPRVWQELKKQIYSEQ
ncbi:hypothetical protein Patl1_33024 [Pistacia atlantica]|uniref:Uncharacterized protein n=1 Tax=Pistacia atlantica TaxID=434234 RepID=A0ACC1AP03_9ROSI|nr:hypothetical protein Patl1_33024 [Pistacia atlantica]